MQLPIKNRRTAGRELAALLDAFKGQDNVVVLGLSGGGVPVAFEIASALRVELDVLPVRTLGVPGHEDTAIGAIATGGEGVINAEVLRRYPLDTASLEQLVRRETIELERREYLYRGDRARPVLRNKTVILVDDGMATGDSMRAALETIRRQAPERVLVAVPVADSVAINRLRPAVEECVALTTPEPVDAVAQWYESFEETRDEEVRNLLRRAWLRQALAEDAEPGENRSTAGKDGGTITRQQHRFH